MAKKQFIPSDRYPYHVICRSNNREWFYLPTSDVWKILIDLIKKAGDAFDVKIHAFVLMSNHFHAVCSTPNANLDAFMNYFLRESAKRINETSERINHVYGGPYKWSLITNRFHYEQVMRYVFQNPLKVGLTDRVENYPYSSLHYQYSGIDCGFPIGESIFELQNLFDYPIWHKMEWLNEQYTPEQRETIRKALYHPIAKFRKFGPRSKLYLTPNPVKIT